MKPSNFSLAAILLFNGTLLSAGNVLSGTSNLSSGMDAVVAGGNTNRANGNMSGVASGKLNYATGNYSFVGAGYKNQAKGYMSAIGGGSENKVEASSTAGVIAGGKKNINTNTYSFTGAGYKNVNSGYMGVIGGGILNHLFSSASQSAIVGGNANKIEGRYGFIGSGQGNHIGIGDHITIGGGQENNATGPDATIGGGYRNNATGFTATVGGGWFNSAAGHSSTIGGGYNNSATGGYATISGGANNSAAGYTATIPGGYDNNASGYYSFAAGYRATAGKERSVAIGTNVLCDRAGTMILADGNVFADRTKRYAAYDNRLYGYFENGYAFYTSSEVGTGVYLAHGDGAWHTASDKNKKENYEAVDGEAILEKLSEIPIMKWNYISQHDHIKHIGPFAQDFYAAFGLGDDDVSISTIDPDGIALKSVQTLYAMHKVDKKRIAELEEKVKTIDTLKARLDRLEALLIK